VVDDVLVRDSVERDSESAETLVADCKAGTEVARKFPSNKIVGLEAVVARAGNPGPDMPAIAIEMDSATASGLLFKLCAFIFVLTDSPTLDRSLFQSQVSAGKTLQILKILVSKSTIRQFN
jgi:hypothetical protein